MPTLYTLIHTVFLDEYPLEKDKNIYFSLTIGQFAWKCTPLAELFVVVLAQEATDDAIRFQQLYQLLRERYQMQLTATL